MNRDFPIEWYDYIVGGKFRLRSASLFSNRPWAGGQNVTKPHTKAWLTDITLRPARDPLLQDFKAFFSSLDGRSGILRLSDATRFMPWADRQLLLSQNAPSYFSDGSRFTDGSGFANGFLPPNVFVNSAAALGSNYLVLAGFPASTQNVLRNGDLLEIKPNGMPASFPHLYEVQTPSDSDSQGRVGIYLTWQLHADVAASDTVSLRFPSTLFRMTTDDQFEFEDSGSGIGSGGGSLFEALDLVP
jgi:hypothetical protein